MHMENMLAERTRRMGTNAIREILKVVARPGMVSLAGGIPAPESFPLDIIRELSDRVLAAHGTAALQYDVTEGFFPLRQALVEHLEKKGIQVTADEILVTSGSQGVLDAAGKILINRNDRVAVEAPTYLGALQAFAPYEPQYACLATDGEGLIPEALEEELSRRPVRLVYLVPTFQNPTGRTLPLARRVEIARIIRKFNVLLVEDDPYSDLRYRGEHLPPIRTFAPEHVIYVSTLSKVFAPGLRIGFCVAPPAIRSWLVRVKQGVDLHTSSFNQALAAEYLSGGHLDRHLPGILSLYKPRQEAMLSALERYFPTDFSWSRPEGGMFIWAEGPETADIDAIYNNALARQTAFVPGKYFYPVPGPGQATMRLNYTMADEATIDRAIRTLGEVIRENLANA